MGVKKQGPFDDSQAQPCVIYARYSSHAQRDASIEQQVADCEEYAQRNGLRVVKIYADRHLTGKNDKRPQFQQMLKVRQDFRVIVLCRKFKRTDRIQDIQGIRVGRGKDIP